MSFDPFSELDRLAQAVAGVRGSAPRYMPVDLIREQDQYVLSADLPGVDPGSVDIDVDGHLLTIRAQRTADGRDGSKWLAQERPHGSYLRQFSLGEGVDPDNISAVYDNGVLNVVLPVSEKAKPRKIDVLTAASSDRSSISS
jgi:HSP20 family protein